LRNKALNKNRYAQNHTFSTLLALLIFLSGCLEKNNTTATESSAKSVNENDTVNYETLRNESLRREASRISASLNDSQLAAQVIISGIDGKGHLTEDMKILLKECPAGGVMLFRYNLDADNGAIQNLIAETAALIVRESAVPPFVAVDHEGGSVSRFRPGVADLPPASSYWELAQNKDKETAIAQINTNAFNVGKSINAIGVNLNFAPMAEYLNENNRVFLDNRSYGPDPVFCAEAAAAFITGMERAGIMCVVKHFPGSAGADPHLFPSALNGDKIALAKLVYPFTILCRYAYMRAIMVSHSAVPAWDGTHIASLSSPIMNDWLRHELGFNGIIICDDFSMASAGGPASAGGTGSIKPEIAAVLSLAAGADMILVWPPDLRRTHRGILSAINDDTLSREHLRETAERIIFEKLRMGIMTNEK
jgi:beta-N-acetylhexosaminidase